MRALCGMLARSRLVIGFVIRTTPCTSKTHEIVIKRSKPTGFRSVPNWSTHTFVSNSKESDCQLFRSKLNL